MPHLDGFTKEPLSENPTIANIIDDVMFACEQAEDYDQCWDALVFSLAVIFCAMPGTEASDRFRMLPDMLVHDIEAVILQLQAGKNLPT